MPDGCTVWAYDEGPRPAGDDSFDRGDIYRILSGEMKNPALERPRQSFQRVLIKDRANRTLYDSASTKANPTNPMGRCPLHPMSQSPQRCTFGETLFGGSRFIFWSLGPLSLLVAGIVVRVAYTQYVEGRFAGCGMAVAASLVCVCFFLALLNGPFFWWAGRVVGASVFGVYLWYLLDTWLIHPKPLSIGGARSGATPWNALCGLAIIGIPCLCYTVLGRFTFRAPPPEDLFSDSDENGEGSGHAHLK